MKRRRILAILVLALGLTVCLTQVGKAVPMGTAWTYQGRLMDANVPADGLYDLEFRLFPDPILNSNQVGGTIDINDLDVIDGYFTVELDFGSSAFNGDARWLEIGVKPWDSEERCTILSPRHEVTPTPYSLYAANADTDNDWMVSGNNLYSIPTGRVGIGTTNPDTGLHLKGAGWPDAFMTLQSDPNEDTGIRLNEGNAVNWHLFNESTADGLSIRNASYSSILFAEQSTGDIGLGVTNPRTDLEILGTTGLRVTTGQTSTVFGDFKHAYSGGLIINAHAGGGGWADMSLQTNATTRMFIESGGNVGIGMGTEVPPERLTVRGNILVQSSSGASVAEIGEGLDYAEGFNVTENADIKAGTVLVIDSDNPGKLTVSRIAYDSKVAGIVAGAKGLGSGVRLGIGQFDHDVALAGRVYCNVDATKEAIQAGDLLTTSALPGHAMKATDYDRARGAILGKAMQKLQKGQKGQILVLVTLQ
ncbi:MAG: hypothetical protein ACYSWZ_14315 [Planctomycetota bacterium]|jgi:hypothetical protein